MNKTVTVNIGGIVFHIDENAYERFKQYLESIRSHFTASDGRDEIMQDIESRIAEIFQERMKDQKQVITLTDVEEVTQLMGKPEQFGDEEAKEKEAEKNTVEMKIKRRLFRNPDDRFLGGVCSGISAFFDLDPIWIRLAFVFALFFFGSGFLLYLILWIIIPKAVTTADKLQMKGEPVTISNIEKNVQEEIANVKKSFEDRGQAKHAQNIFTRIFDAVIQIFKLIFVFIGKLFAVFFLLIGLLVSFVMFAALFAVFKVPGVQYPEIINQVLPTGMLFGIAVIAATFVVGIPFLMLAYFGARELFNIKRSSRIFNLSALGLWLAAIVTCGILGASIARQYSEKQSIRKEISLMQPASRTITLKVNRKDENEKEYENWDDNEWNGDLRLSLKENQLQSRDVKFDIVESNTDSFELVQICYARGASRKLAADHATRISYSFNQLDSVLSFNPYFSFDKDEKYHAQKMQLILKVPRGGKVFIDKSMHGFLYDIKNTDNILDYEMLEHKWEMTESGLSCLDCNGSETKMGDGDVYIHGGHGGRVHISNKGVYIKGDNDEEVIIDSTGVHVNGEKKKVR